MAGEAIDVLGAWAQILAPAAVAAGAMSAGSSSTVAGIGATEAAYTLLDFRLSVTAGTPTQGAAVHLYRRPSDGTNVSPAPSAGYREQFAGSFVLDAATGEYVLRGVPTGDPNDTWYVYNDDAVSLTLGLSVRGRSVKAAP